MAVGLAGARQTGSADALLFVQDSLTRRSRSSGSSRYHSSPRFSTSYSYSLQRRPNCEALVSCVQVNKFGLNRRHYYVSCLACPSAPVGACMSDTRLVLRRVLLRTFHGQGWFGQSQRFPFPVLPELQVPCKGKLPSPPGLSHRKGLPALGTYITTVGRSYNVGDDLGRGQAVSLLACLYRSRVLLPCGWLPV